MKTYCFSVSVWVGTDDGPDVAARHAAVNLRRNIEKMNDSELADNLELFDVGEDENQCPHCDSLDTTALVGCLPNERECDSCGYCFIP